MVITVYLVCIFKQTVIKRDTYTILNLAQGFGTNILKYKTIRQIKKYKFRVGLCVGWSRLCTILLFFLFSLIDYLHLLYVRQHKTKVVDPIESLLDAFFTSLVMESSHN